MLVYSFTYCQNPEDGGYMFLRIVG
jgi:hypothetical protein